MKGKRRRKTVTSKRKSGEKRNRRWRRRRQKKQKRHPRKGNKRKKRKKTKVKTNSKWQRRPRKGEEEENEAKGPTQPFFAIRQRCEPRRYRAQHGNLFNTLRYKSFLLTFFLFILLSLSFSAKNRLSLISYEWRLTSLPLTL